MDLSKAFDRIPHDLLRAKLVAYSFDKKVLNYIYSYFNNWKLCENQQYEKWFHKYCVYCML